MLRSSKNTVDKMTIYYVCSTYNIQVQQVMVWYGMVWPCSISTAICDVTIYSTMQCRAMLYNNTYCTGRYVGEFSIFQKYKFEQKYIGHLKKYIIPSLSVHKDGLIREA